MRGRSLMLMLSCAVMLGVIASTYAVDKPDVQVVTNADHTVFHLADLQIPAGNTFAATVVSDPAAQLLEQEDLSSLIEFLNNDPAIQGRLKTYWAEKEKIEAAADDPLKDKVSSKESTPGTLVASRANRLERRANRFATKANRYGARSHSLHTAAVYSNG